MRAIGLAFAALCMACSPQGQAETAAAAPQAAAVHPVSGLEVIPLTVTSGGKRRISAFDLLDEHASTIQPGSNGLMVLPYFMGERSPIWDVDARGTITGMTLNHTKSHLYRAMLESVAYALKNNIDYGSAAFPGLEDQLTVVGDVSKSDLWVEIITNVTGRPVRVLPNSGKAAYGAAVIAAYGIGMIDRQQMGDWLSVQPARVLTPDAAASAVYERSFENFKRLYEHMKSYFPTATET